MPNPLYVLPTKHLPHRHVVQPHREPMLNSQELAQRLGISINKISLLVRNEGLPFIRLGYREGKGERRRYRMSDVRKWMKSREEEQ
jgi:excisionase family DNA binding protein